VRIARWVTATAGTFALIAGLSGCPSSRVDGLNVAELPAGLRDDYGLFAQRCSKCHSLARPLESGITDDGYWRAYVERMRRQPSSGISQADEPPILRFLHYYSTEQKRSHAPVTEDGG
jgi:hypothetical protein